MNQSFLGSISKFARYLGTTSNRKVVSSHCCRCLSISTAKYADVLVNVENGVKTITLNRPSRYNALNDQLCRELARHLSDSQKDENVKIIAFTGAGDKYYSSGYDLKCLVDNYESGSGHEITGANEFIRELIEARKPLVAVVNGSAVGIGVTMLAHFEAVYAVDTATFTTPFMKLGIAPECCSSYLFPKMAGPAKAAALLLFNGTWSAKEACQNGLVTKIFSPETFQDEAWKRVKEMAQHPLQALLHSKELLRGPEREVLRKVMKQENSLFDIDVVGPKAVELLKSKRRKN